VDDRDDDQRAVATLQLTATVLASGSYANTAVATSTTFDPTTPNTGDGDAGAGGGGRSGDPEDGGQSGAERGQQRRLHGDGDQ